MIRIVIEGDMTTGHVKITGPIEEPRVWHWMLGEALRVCHQRANEQDAAASNGKGAIEVVGHLPPGRPPA